jgi:hypothetical protein
VIVATTAGVDSTGNAAAYEAHAARLDGKGRGPSRLSSTVVICSFVSGWQNLAMNSENYSCDIGVDAVGAEEIDNRSS